MDIRLNAAVQQALRMAQSLAREHMHAAFGAPHMLKALLHKDLGLESQLWQMDQDVYYMEEWADVRMESCRKAPAPKDAVPGDDAVTAILEEADAVRLLLNEEETEPMHVLIALSTAGVGFSYDQLKSWPLGRDMLLGLVRERAEIQELLNGQGGTGAGVGYGGRGAGGEGMGAKAGGVAGLQGGGKIGTGAGTKAILKFCRDKTLDAAQGKMDPVIGREQEIRRMAEILSRRSKPNVMIVGEPGVGKSALADGLALAIYRKEVPAHLQEARLLELDNGALIAGASYKGEVEERLRSVIQEIQSFDRAILFIDEIHGLLDRQGVSAGVVNLLKPELARGRLTVIGATTLEEYRKHIEKDEAFARRFELLVVDEPDAAAAFRMLKAVMPKYESHHRLTADDDTLREAVRLAGRYMKDRQLPDAAIDLVDRSMAALRLAIDTGEEVAGSFRRAFAGLDGAAAEEREQTSDGEGRKGQASEEAQRVMEAYQWHYTQCRHALGPLVWAEVAPENDLLKIGEPNDLRAALEALHGRLETVLPVGRTRLQGQDVAALVADKTGIPVGKLQAQEKEQLLNMPGVLRRRVVGQDHAIATISEAIIESRSGLSKPGQPLGSFFFLGPTGTGKTELAKALAGYLFQDEKFMIRFDMSEFKEEHAAALLYGAPPGYVGYEEGGLLVNKIRQQPYAVVLFDEIEKAHASVFDIFLQIMDEGRLHDKLGKEGDFSNAIIIFTSNIASKYITQAFGRGAAPGHAELLDLMAHHFRPEFLGRLTEIVPFAPMDLSMVEAIFRIQVQGIHELLARQGIGLTITPAAARQIATMGFTPEYGARPLAGMIRGQLRRPLSKMIVSGELHGGSEILLDVEEGGKLIWKK